MKRRKLLDPHCHLWQLNNQPCYHDWLSANNLHPMLGNLTAINHDFVKADYLSVSHGFDVTSVIAIESVATQYARAEVDCLTNTFADDNFLGGIVAGIDLLAESATALLAYYATQPLVKGVRQLLNWSKQHPKYAAASRSDDLLNPKWLANFSLLAQYALSFDMQICPEQLPLVIDLVQHHPAIKIIINHAGFPIKEYLPCWFANMKQLANYPNVFVKLSGFGMLDHRWTQQSIADYVYFIIEQFGVKRCMFASNFPVDGLYSSYNELMQAYIELSQCYSAIEQQQLFHDNAKAIYCINE